MFNSIVERVRNTWARLRALTFRTVLRIVAGGLLIALLALALALPHIIGWLFGMLTAASVWITSDDRLWVKWCWNMIFRISKWCHEPKV